MSDTLNNYNVATDLGVEKLRKELRVTRIFSMISSILMICIIVGGLLICNAAKGYVEQVWPLIEQLETVDFAAIDETVKTVDKSLNAVDWEYMSEQLSKLNVDAINEAIAGLDTQELTKALENINSAAETLQNMSGSLKAFTSKFGF